MIAVSSPVIPRWSAAERFRCAMMGISAPLGIQSGRCRPVRVGTSPT